MTTTNTLIGGVLAALVLLLGAIFTGIQTAPDLSLGGAGEGLAATLNSATTTTVGPQAVSRVTIFSKVPDCSARVITTNYAAIWLNFDEPKVTGNISSTTLSNAAGHYQAASTTVAYDGEIYGCGKVTGYAIASTTITASEF